MSEKIRNIISILLLIGMFFVPMITGYFMGNNDHVVIVVEIKKSALIMIIATIMWLSAIVISPEAVFSQND